MSLCYTSCLNARMLSSYTLVAAVLCKRHPPGLKNEDNWAQKLQFLDWPTESPVNISTEINLYIFTYCLPFMIGWIITLRLEVSRVWPRFLRKNKILETNKAYSVQRELLLWFGAYSKIFFLASQLCIPLGLASCSRTHVLQGIDNHCTAWATSTQTWLQQHPTKDAHSGSF